MTEQLTDQSAATPRVCAAKDSHKLSFANDDFKIDLRVETCTENQWARIVRSVMGEISRPDSMLVLPVPLSEKEAERVKNEWLRKVKV